MSNEPTETVAVLNLTSVAGIVVCFAAAAVALFALPTLERQGISFETAFWMVSAVELVTVLGIIYFILNLHEERG
ncbi:hypothetical protein [Halorubrum sp. SD626R]|jgi:hypothetical protein|uniref:hypothetical protein n=1 Tax=Halorubrum sp. SD626R TaxID=1419722 RepID=UPI000ACA1EC7|nr:hypothetical protein [Halorubrum sp. SD626R]TKX80079.1 hypothetical protein EXE53_12530 [Halorubrum sp. SD626R]